MAGKSPAKMAINGGFNGTNPRESMGKFWENPQKVELEMGTSSIKLSIAVITRGSAAKNDVGFCGDLNGIQQNTTDP